MGNNNRKESELLQACRKKHEIDDESWNDFFARDDVNKALEYVEERINIKDISPSKEHVLRFVTQDLSKVKHIIVGNDPYPEKGIATGRAFEVGKNKGWKKINPSLQNIIKAICYIDKMHSIMKDEDITEILKIQLSKKDEKSDDMRNVNYIIKDPSTWFNDMEERGVLFLNSTLTIRGEEHHHKMWQKFRTCLINHIASKNKEIKWHLWGSDSQCRIENLLKKHNIEEENILKSCHPSNKHFVYESTLYALIEDGIDLIEREENAEE